MRNDVTLTRGEQFVFTGIVTKGGVGYPTNPAGFKLRFVAKRKLSDAIPLIDRNNVDNPTQVVLGNGGVYTVTLLAADTATFTVTELLAYSVTLIEPDGTTTEVDYGTLKVKRGAAT